MCGNTFPVPFVLECVRFCQGFNQGGVASLDSGASRTSLWSKGGECQHCRFLAVLLQEDAMTFLSFRFLSCKLLILSIPSLIIVRIKFEVLYLVFDS